MKRLREKKRELDEEEEEEEEDEEQVKSVEQELEMIKEIQMLRQSGVHVEVNVVEESQKEVRTEMMKVSV